MQTLGEKIKVLIKAKGWDMKDFAEEVEYNPSAFSRMLNTIDQEDRIFAKIAKALGVSAEWICSQDEIGKGNIPASFAAPAQPESSQPQADELKRDIAELKKEVVRLASECHKRGVVEDRLLNIIEHLTRK